MMDQPKNKLFSRLRSIGQIVNEKLKNDETPQSTNASTNNTSNASTISNTPKSKSKSRTPESASSTTKAKRVQLKLMSDSGFMHDGPIIALNVPNLNKYSAILKWYKYKRSEEELCETPIFECSDSNEFIPNITDVGYHICCQYIPIGLNTQYLPSKITETPESLKQESTIFRDTQTLLDRSKCSFDIIIPHISQQIRHKFIVEGYRMYLHINDQSTRGRRSRSNSMSKSMSKSRTVNSNASHHSSNNNNNNNHNAIIDEERKIGQQTTQNPLPDHHNHSHSHHYQNDLIIESDYNSNNSNLGGICVQTYFDNIALTSSASNPNANVSELESEDMLMDSNSNLLSTSSATTHQSMNNQLKLKALHQEYKIKAGWNLKLNRKFPLEFDIFNAKHHLVLNARCQSRRERDIMQLYFRALLRLKDNRAKSKKSSSDLVFLELHVLDGKHRLPKEVMKSHEFQRKQEKVRHQNRELTNKVIQLQKDKGYLRAQNFQLENNEERFKEMSLLKNAEIQNLSSELDTYKEDNDLLQREILEFQEKIEALEDCKFDFEQKISAKDKQLHEKGQIIKKLKSENDVCTQKLEVKNQRLQELAMEISEIEDDKEQLAVTLKTNSMHVGFMKDEKTQMDTDFGTLNEEMIRFKKEARQWKSKYNAKQREIELLQIDFDSLKARITNFENEIHLKSSDIQERDFKIREQTEQIKQMAQLKAEYKDIQFEIAGRDEQIQRLKVESEQLKNDLHSENKESQRNQQKVQVMLRKYDKLVSKNSKLQAQIDEFENRVIDSVARPLHTQLQKELKQYKKSLENTTSERDLARGEVSDLKRELSQITDESRRLKREHQQALEEVSQLQSHNQFWKNKFKSLRTEVARQRIPPTVSDLAAMQLSSNHQNGNHSGSNNSQNSLASEHSRSHSHSHSRRHSHSHCANASASSSDNDNDNDNDDHNNNNNSHHLKRSKKKKAQSSKSSSSSSSTKSPNSKSKSKSRSSKSKSSHKSKHNNVRHSIINNNLLSVSPSIGRQQSGGGISGNLRLDVRQLTEEIEQLNEELDLMRKSRDNALLSVFDLQRALKTELQRNSEKKFQKALHRVRASDEVKALMKQKTDLTLLANTLSDTVSDKEINIEHLKKVLKLLGNRVTELEAENARLQRNGAEMFGLEHSHSVAINPNNNSNNNNNNKSPKLQNGHLLKKKSIPSVTVILSKLSKNKSKNVK